MSSAKMEFIARRWGLKFYYASPSRRFARPGIYVWIGPLRRYFRVLRSTFEEVDPLHEPHRVEHPHPILEPDRDEQPAPERHSDPEPDPSVWRTAP